MGFLICDYGFTDTKCSKPGYIVATGAPEKVAQNEASHTGRFLRDILA